MQKRVKLKTRFTDEQLPGRKDCHRSGAESNSHCDSWEKGNENAKTESPGENPAVDNFTISVIFGHDTGRTHRRCNCCYREPSAPSLLQFFG